MKILNNWEEPTKVSLFTSCKQAARLVSLSFERKLTFREYLAMWIHLMMCKTCTCYKRQITALRAIFCRHEEMLDQTPPSNDERLSEDSKKRIRELIDKGKD